MLTQGRCRHESQCGLESDQPAGGGRNAQRSSAVGAERQGHHSRGHRRGGPARGPARPPSIVPGVVRDAVASRFGRRELPELRHRCAAEDDRVCRTHAAHEFTVLCGRRRVTESAQRCHVASNVELVLHQHGDTGQWSALVERFGVHRIGRREGLRGKHIGDGVQVAVALGDAGEGGLRCPAGRQLAAVDEVGGFTSGQSLQRRIVQVCGTHQSSVTHRQWCAGAQVTIVRARTRPSITSWIRRTVSVLRSTPRRRAWAVVLSASRSTSR